MKKILLSTFCCFFSVWLSAQFVYKIKADSVLITNDSCTAELNLENSTKDTLGFLYNKGKGRTEFRRMVKKIDSITYVIGGTDTIRTNGSSIANTIYTGDGSITGTRNVNFTTIGGGISFNMKTATDASFTRYKNSYFMTNPDWGGRVFATYMISDDDSALTGFSVVNDNGGVNRGNELGAYIAGSKTGYNFGGQTQGTFIRSDRQPITIIADNQGNPSAAYPIQFYTGTNFFQDNTSSIPTLRLNGDQTIDIKSTMRLGNLSSDPTGSNGMLYYNSTNNKFRGYQNGAWMDLIGGGTAATWQQTLTTGSTLTTNNTITMGTTTFTMNGSTTSPQFLVANSSTGNSIKGTTTGNGTGVWGETSGNGWGVYGQAANGTGVQGISTSSGTGVWAQTNTGIAVTAIAGDNAELFDGSGTQSNTNTVRTLTNYQLISSGTVSNGFGQQHNYLLETSLGGGTGSVAARQVISWADVTHATRTSWYDIQGVSGGTEQRFMNIQPTLVRINNDADTLATKAYARSVGGGGNGLLTADNGLTANTSTNVQLGGTLTGNTTITTTANYKLSISSTSSSQPALDVINAGGGNGISGVSSTGYGLYAQSNNIASRIVATPSSGNTVTTLMNLERGNGAGAGSDGIGQSLDFYLSTSLNNRLSNQIISKFTTANDATRTSQFIITGVNNGSTGNKFILSGNGALQLPGYGSGTFTGTATKTLQVDASGNIIEGTVGGGSGMADPGANGIVARTALNTTTARTITGTTNEISISNGDGVSGNPTISLPSTLALASKSVTVQDNNFTVQDDGDNTKKFKFDAGSIPASTTVTLTSPSVTSTLVSYKTTSEASNTTPAPTGDAKSNEHFITALAANATVSAPSGTLTNGNRLIIRIKDNGTARTLTWNSVFRGGSDIALPTTTTVSKTMYLGFIYNSTDSKWDLIAYINNL